MRSLAPCPCRRGGALILALLFMGVVTMGFAAWVNLIHQRARLGDFEQFQAAKRLASSSARILNRDYLLRRTLASNGDDDGLTATTDASTSWNTATATSWTTSASSSTNWNGNSQSQLAIWTGYPMDSLTRPAGLNAFSPSFDYPYGRSFTFTTSYKQLSYRNIDNATNPGREEYATDTTSVRGIVRSRSPLLSGDLLVLHQPTVTATLPTVTGNIAVNGRVIHFAPDASTYSVRSQRFSSPTNSTNFVPLDLAGASLIQGNLPWIPLSSGNISGADLATNGDDWRLPDFTGQLNVIDASTTNASNSLRSEVIARGPVLPVYSGSVTASDNRGFALDGTTGIATISPCVGYPTADLPSTIIGNDLNEIIIEGQTGTNFSGYAQNRPSMVVVYTQANSGRNLTTIRLRNQNRRRMLLALKKDHRSTGGWDPTVNLIVETPGTAAEWHLLIVCENVPLNITTTSATTVTLTGGIQTNSPLTFHNYPKLLEISLETNTRGLIRMSPRLAWVETYLTGKL